MEMGIDGLADQAVSGVLERLGVASILVIAAVFMLRYFMSQLEKKDTRVSELTDRFLVATREQTSVISQNTDALRELKDAVRAK